MRSTAGAFHRSDGADAELRVGCTISDSECGELRTRGLRNHFLHRLPELRIDDGIVLAGVDVTLVRDFAPIKPVLQHQV